MSRHDRKRTARPAQPAPLESPEPRQQPSAIKLVLIVALIVAFDILLFFAIGYAIGNTIL